jgi:nucleoside-diphosphate-sugar epimerase
LELISNVTNHKRRTQKFNISFKFIHDDILHDDLYHKLPTDLDAIIHLAAQINVYRCLVNPEETSKINVEGTLKVLEFARMNDIKKILHASTNEAVPIGDIWTQTKR